MSYRYNNIIMYNYPPVILTLEETEIINQECNKFLNYIYSKIKYLYNAVVGVICV